ncbi:hypothetical protein VSX64_25660, partial [Aurantimonas sp. C2-6-R+9]|nr:hypothetical protein [Aurantimonas sp. C2-6-R+9]
LQSGDFYVVGSEQFADYRTQLLPWTECQPRLAAYCEALAMPQTGDKFVVLLKSQLTEAAATVDANFPANATLSLDPDGTPHLKQLRPKEPVD